MTAKSSLPIASSSLVVPVTECYTDVLQGEGPSAGTFCSFLRFTGCHRSCDWCDSTHTWKKGEIQTTKLSLSSLYDTLHKGRARKLVLTGGEPLLHQDKPYFKELLKWPGWQFEIETEGTFAPSQQLQELADDFILRVNCSPKLSHAGMGDLSATYKQSLPRLLEMPLTILKFVVRNEADVQEAWDLAYEVGASTAQVYLMPEGQTKQGQIDAIETVYDLAVKYGLNFMPRLHVLRWDKKKGV
jgi:organic radical activating enzyme